MQCPGCGKEIPISGTLLAGAYCADCRGKGIGASPQTPSAQVEEAALLTSVRKTQLPVVNRYRDAYRVATFLVALGNTIKIIGLATGAIVFLVFASAGQQFGSGAGAIVGMVFGGIAAGIGFVLGVLVSAQGQILRATLDTSVSASQFMTNHERTVAMGLPAAVAEPEQILHIPVGSSHLRQTPAERAAEQARGTHWCKVCGAQIPPTARQICREKELCEDHL